MALVAQPETSSMLLHPDLWETQEEVSGHVLCWISLGSFANRRRKLSIQRTEAPTQERVQGAWAGADCTKAVLPGGMEGLCGLVHQAVAGTALAKSDLTISTPQAAHPEPGTGDRRRGPRAQPWLLPGTESRDLFLDESLPS